MSIEDRRGETRAGATLNDVAALAGVSRQTVSNALNAPDLLRPETLSHVRAAIEELDYRPNRNARSLRTQKSGLIGFGTFRPKPDRLWNVLDRFLHAVTDAARRADYHVVVFTPENEAQELEMYGSLLRTRSIDGFILTDVGADDERPAWLRRHRAPFVSLGRTPDRGDPWVDVDGAAGTGQAVDHLVELGHRDIAFLGWPEGSRIGDDRHHGWRSAMERHGLAGHGSVIREDDTMTAAHRAGWRLLEESRPTAVVAASDTMAVGALRAAHDLGMTVGRDLAVVGFDDTPSAPLLTPPLTSLAQPLEEVGQLLVKNLAAQLSGGRPRPQALLEPTLVVRGSTGFPDG